MRRNVLKAAEKGQRLIEQNETYDLYTSEIQQLYDILKGKGADGIFNALTTAYLMGIEAGSRLQKQRG